MFAFYNSIDKFLKYFLNNPFCQFFYRCRIVDFHKSTGPLGTHPRLFEWILSYYASEREGSPKAVCTSKPPIYLQHQG